MKKFLVAALLALSVQHAAAEPSYLRFVGKTYSYYGVALKQQVALYHGGRPGLYSGTLRCRGRRCLTRFQSVAVQYYVDYTFVATTNYCDIWGSYGSYSMSGYYECYNGDAGTVYLRRTR